MSETITMNDDDRWQAVQARDRESDGRFVYAVRSTGIYCRPSCPSRRPHRRHVSFFDRADLAERHGFRACRRCQPHRRAMTDSEIIQQACRYIDEHPDGPLTLSDLGARVGLSPHHLQRRFKAAMGLTPRQYAEARRVERLKAGLRDGASVTDALYEAGYGSGSRLYEQAPAQLGMSPATYRKRGKGMQIRYTVTTSRLGWLLVGLTERGVCAVSLGDAIEPLEEALRQEYAAAAIHREDDALHPWVGAILRYLDGAPASLDLPLDVQATAFQWQVWRALQAIPFGATHTYSQIARSLGQPNAARAVGAACAANPVALVVPCHRAVREDGGLGGYRWGLERKEALLEQEREASADRGRANRDPGTI